MRTRLAFLALLLSLVLTTTLIAQEPAKKPTRGWLTVENIMRDPKWMGISPSNPQWSEDGQWLFFRWRTKEDKADSLYAISAKGGTPRRATLEEQRSLNIRGGVYTKDYSRRLYSNDGDIIIQDRKTKALTQLTNTLDNESNPRYSFDEKKIIYERGGNLYMRELATAIETQLTNIISGGTSTTQQTTPQFTGMMGQGQRFGGRTQQGEGGGGGGSAQMRDRTESKMTLQQYLQNQQMQLFDVLRERRAQRGGTRGAMRLSETKRKKPFNTGTKNMMGLALSPDEHFVTFTLIQNPTDPKRTIVPSYITESGYTEDINGRTKVGEPLASYEFNVYNLALDSVMQVKPDNIPGIMPVRAASDTVRRRPVPPRAVSYSGPFWSDDGKNAFVQVFSQDNKDRWIVILDPDSAKFGTVLNHQHDNAWIGGPGVRGGFGFGGGGGVGWMPDSKRIYFQSEEDGWSHLYTISLDGKAKAQLTKGKFEIYNLRMSRDKKRWFFSSNEVHFGERHFYTMSIDGGDRTRITMMEGWNEVTLSPTEDRLAILYSFSNIKEELYLMENKPAAKLTKVTESVTEEFLSYDWRVPEVLTIKARDGADVPVRLYKPEKPNGAAVIFVHGAGYLQNVTKGWSDYFHEYMFNNLLTDKGYTVLDMDYRASAGLGRDWRTAIYRHMGGKDLDDHVDGAKWLAANHGVDPKRIGLYGGSYGGFITLMAMFTQPDVFAAGAALRPVTDWAHYNHGYTAPILNIPQEDTLAYRQSSPIYFADGLKGSLLICHGMVDVNVHFQDAVRLVQRLIELKKENWELAVYPVEDHGFQEPTSWMDEYKRILKLFETKLGKQ
ncbi:MAG: prolyl oligopeptidase family serine peptidase [bacterium]